MLHLRRKMSSSPRFHVFIVLLTILSTETCYGQSGKCSYRYCSHPATLVCGSGGLVILPCVVYNATGPIQMRWYHIQNGNPADGEELNITTGGRYIVEESEQSPRYRYYENCTEGGQLYRNTLHFNYSDTDSGSYWCRIVIGGDTPLELSEPWTVQSISAPATCGLGSEQTDPKCAGQITPILLSTTLFVQSTPTSVVRATSEPSVSVTTVTHSLVQTHRPVQIHSPVQTYSPVETLSAWSTSVSSVPSSYSSSVPPSPECGGTPCSVYGLAAGLGTLTLVLLVATVSVLVCIKLYLQRAKKITAPSSHEHQPEDDYCLPEEVQRRDESNTGTYQDLSLDTMDYTSMYSKIQDSCRQQTPTVARGGHVYAVVDSTTVEPSSQYAKLQ